jgi:hypothetical protein
VARSLERAQAQISDGNGGTFNHLRDKDAADVVTTIEGQGYDVEFFEGVNIALGRGFKSQYGSDTVADATVRRTLYISATPFPSSLAQMQVYPLGPYDNQSETLVQTVVDAYLEGLNGNGSIIVIREEVSATPDKLLDTYTGAAAAFSIRKLDKDYTGNCMRIRRDSDDAETDIGFDSSGDLDTSAISSHGGASSCFVVTWYDQSGNSRNATQSTPANQPQIYNGSAVITENGKPALKANSGSNNLGLATTLNPDYQQEAWFFGVLKVTGNSIPVATTNNKYFGLSISGGTGGTASGFTNLTYYSDGTALSSPTSGDLYNELTTQSLLTVDHEWGSTDETPFYQVGGYGFFSRNIFQEYIIWQTSQSTNRTGIETNINNYFSIYT